jgi:hypothetical protein
MPARMHMLTAVESISGRIEASPAALADVLHLAGHGLQVAAACFAVWNSPTACRNCLKH